MVAEPVYREGDLKSRVLSATNIVELISKTVPLTRRGKNFVGLCPFHDEKSPSFNVDPVRQFFHCFGCKKGGNAVDFVMERDRLAFMDALRQLAEAAHIPVGSRTEDSAKRGEIQVLRDAQAAACDYFEQMLAHPQQGKAARDYLASRGFTSESVRLFRIGLAVPGWDGFTKGPQAKRFTPQQLLAAGLAKPNDKGGIYDTFRNRLMFPIRDPEGRIIAFGGRAMPGSDDKAKYLNSPETPLFEKSRCAFGLDLAKEKIVQSRTVAIVEGYTDVVMAHQFGCANVVSTLGTALTAKHLTVLRRFADKIVLVFDPDLAGDTAVDRAVELFLTQDQLDIAVASLPDGLDPDEFLLKNGAEAFNATLASAADALTYKWKQLIRHFREHEQDLTGQQKAVEAYLSLLAGARGSGPVDSLRWGAALSRVSRLTDIPAEELHRRFRIKTGPRQAQRAPAPRGMPSLQSAAEQPVASAQSNTTGAAPLTLAQEQAESLVLGALLADASQWVEVQRLISPADFGAGPRRTLAEIVWQYQRDEGDVVFTEFLDVLPSAELRSLALQLVNEVTQSDDTMEALTTGVGYFVESRRRSGGEHLAAQLRRQGEAPMNEADQIAVLQRLSDASKIPDLRRI